MSWELQIQIWQSKLLVQGGYYVDTVGKNTKKIADYIASQLKEDQITDQISMKEYMNPFKGNSK